MDILGPRTKGADRLLPWIIALIVAFSALIWIAFVSSLAGLQQMKSELTSAFTVQVSWPAEATTSDQQQRVAQVEALLNDRFGAEAVEQLAPADQVRVLGQLLAADSDLAGLPVPTLFTLTSPRPAGLAVLQRELSEAVPGVAVDDASSWTEQLERTGTVLRVAGGVLLSASLVAVLLLAVMATRLGMGSRRDLLDILQLIGATPRFVADSFARRMGGTGFIGGVLGLTLTGLLIASLALLSRLGASSELNFLLLPRELFAFHGLMLAVLLLPVLVSLACGLTARIIVARALDDGGEG